MVLNLLNKVVDKGERRTGRIGLDTQTAERQVAVRGIEGIQLAQAGVECAEIAAEVLGHQTAEDDVAVEHHADVVESEREVIEVGLPRIDIAGGTLLQMDEEAVQRAVKIV